MMVRFAIVAALAAVATPASAQVVALSQHAQVQVGGQVGGAPVNSFVDGSSAAATTAGGSKADGLGNSVTVSGRSSIAATLSSAAAGDVVFSQGVDVAQVLNTSTADDLSGTANASGTYIYTFTTTSVMRFALDWSASSFGEQPGGPAPALVAWLSPYATSGFIFYSDPIADGTGKISALIGPGSYSFNLQNFYLTTANDFTPASAGLDARLGFSMSSVPEPATWAFMILGFGAVGSTMRRRRPAVVAC